MKINYELNDDLTIKSYTAYPFNNELPWIEDSVDNIAKIIINQSKVIDNRIVNINADLMLKMRNKASFRAYREVLFKAFDIYKGNVFYGIINENNARKDVILTWYREMCDFPEVITENTTSNDYPDTPLEIQNYLY